MLSISRVFAVALTASSVNAVCKTPSGNACVFPFTYERWDSAQGVRVNTTFSSCTGGFPGSSYFGTGVAFCSKKTFSSWRGDLGMCDMSTGCSSDVSATTNIAELLKPSALCEAGWYQGHPTDVNTVTDNEGATGRSMNISRCALLGKFYADLGIISAWGHFDGVKAVADESRSDYCSVFSGNFATVDVEDPDSTDLFCRAVPSIGAKAATSVNELISAEAKALCPAGWKQGKPKNIAKNGFQRFVKIGDRWSKESSPSGCAAAAVACAENGGNDCATKAGGTITAWVAPLDALIVLPLGFENTMNCYVYSNFTDYSAAEVVGHADEVTIGFSPFNVKDHLYQNFYCPIILTSASDNTTPRAPDTTTSTTKAFTGGTVTESVTTTTGESENTSSKVTSATTEVTTVGKASSASHMIIGSATLTITSLLL